LFGLRKLHDVVGGIAQSHELASPSSSTGSSKGRGGNRLQTCDQLSAFRNVLNVQFAFSSAASAAAMAGPIVALS
jgi:hypothetical protein